MCYSPCVDISEATKRHLKADFTCYNGNGVERDTFLRTMNIKTYFIKPEEHVTVCCCLFLCLFVCLFVYLFVSLEVTQIFTV